MAHTPVHLRCSYLSSMEESYAAIDSEVGDASQDSWFKWPVLAHWQLECHGIIFEIRREGSTLNPTLAPSECRKEDDKRKVFYEQEIGTTTLSAEDVYKNGCAEIPGGTYSRFFRNCQTTTKNLAEKIITKENMNPDFEWPWRSSNAVTCVIAGAAAGVAVFYLAPVIFASAQTDMVYSGGTMIGKCTIDWSYGWKCVMAGGRWTIKRSTTVLQFIGEKEVLQMPLDMRAFQTFLDYKLLPVLRQTFLAGSIVAGYMILAQPATPEFLYSQWDRLWSRGLSDQHQSQRLAAFRKMMQTVENVRPQAVVLLT